MLRRQWVGRQLATYVYFVFGVNFTAGWSRYLMGDHVSLPGWLYPFIAAISFWGAVKRLIEDHLPPAPEDTEETAP